MIKSKLFDLLSTKYLKNILGLGCVAKVVGGNSWLLLGKFDKNHLALETTLYAEMDSEIYF